MLKTQVSSPRAKFQVQESSFKFKSQVSRSRVKRGQRAHLLPADFKKRTKKETKGQNPSATSMTTARSQSLAMSTPLAPSATLVPASPESTPALESPLSPGWIHAISILMGHPLTLEPGKCIQKRILYQGILDYTYLVITWDPIQFGEKIDLQKYEEIDGSIAYLKYNTVKQIGSLMKYMILLMNQGRPC